MIPYSMQNILVPIDLSEPSLNALDTAVDLARQNAANIHLLFVEDAMTNIADRHSGIFVPRQASTDVLVALAGAVRHANGIHPTVTETEGGVAEKIILSALQLQCDLVVMGTHGASGFRDGFIGSNTYNVIKYAPFPVLTIPPSKKFTAFKKMLFPVRAMPGALRAYEIAAHFLDKDAAVDVLGLSSLKIERDRTGVLDKLVAEIKPQLELKNVTITTAWANGIAVPTDIFEFGQQNNTDLIVVTPALDAVSKPGFVGPHSQKLIHASKLPILHIKNAGAAYLSSRPTML